MSDENEQDEPISASERMKEILARRDEIRQESEERARQGLSPFPTVSERSAA